MVEPGRTRAPEGVIVDAVDWLPSGARSGIVRVRGRRAPGTDPGLPELVVEHAGELRRFASLPDSRAGSADAWRGAYVIEAELAAQSPSLTLEWPGGFRQAVGPLRADAGAGAGVAPAAPVAAEPGGEVVERAVLAERRARRAEAVEHAQARIAREALRAVEVLELRAGEIEDQLHAVRAERDALRERLEPVGEPGPGQREAELEAAVTGLRADLAARPRPQPAAEAVPGFARIEPGEAQRRAVGLQRALTAAVTTVAVLRLALHEAQLARRTREVVHAADAVALAAVRGERTALIAARDAARGELRAARVARDAASVAVEEQRAATVGAQAAHDETRRRLVERVTELREARERIAELDAALAGAHADAARETAGAAEAVVLRDELDRAQQALVRAETAREAAVAAALAAAAERRAAAVAHSAVRPSSDDATRERALEAELAGLRIELAAARRPPPPAPDVADDPAERTPDTPPPAPAEVLAAAAEQARVAAERTPLEAPGAERVVADLSAAADALRARTTIVPAAEDPPGAVARGRGGRAYPPLRGALVKLAHDDPRAAAQLLTGLLPALHRVLDGPLEIDLSLAERGTLAIDVGESATEIRTLPDPRRRRDARTHLRTDALTLAEALAGVGPRVRRRRGALRATHHPRRARALLQAAARGIPLAELVRAGARLDPAVALRAFAYAVPSSWTAGHAFAIEVAVDGEPTTLEVGDGGGLRLADPLRAAAPSARLRLTRAAFDALLAGDEPEPDGLVVEGDRAAVQTLRGWADRVRAVAPGRKGDAL